VIGDLQAALKDCNEALRLRPNFVDALDSRGLVNLKSGQTKNAIADFDAALKINPPADLVAVRPRPRQAAKRLDFRGRTGYIQCQGHGSEYCQGIRELRGTLTII
jgi:tetratricopeptide (TPR) repeat protein